MQHAQLTFPNVDVPENPTNHANRQLFVSRQVRRLTATGMLIVALALSAFSAPVAAQDQVVAVESAVQWLLKQQMDDGGFAGFSGESDPGATADAVLALASANAVGIEIDLELAMKYLEANALVFAQTNPGSAAKLSMAAVATGWDPHNIDNINPMSIVEVASGMGMIGQGPFEHALGLPALAATGTVVPEAAIEAARGSQAEDGSWAWDGSLEPGVGDTNTTAMMVQGLIAVGVRDEMVDRAMAYLTGAVNEDGGYPYQPGAETDSNSTAMVLQALIAAADPTLDEARDAALAALLGLQNESGAFAYMASVPDDNAFATVQAISAASGVAFPIPAVMTVLATPPADPEATPAG
ncbi:MAG: terpene cyclase/mutase family protein [Thermomicrobiales bacterium]|nr:terpene cyclase/mutase family protein [Thermomicrobiales bacterium]